MDCGSDGLVAFCGADRHVLVCCFLRRYLFFFAKQKIESVFGYRVVHVDDSSGKEMYFVLNSVSSQEHLLLMNKNGKAASRGFLMMVLGLLWCAPARRLSEGPLSRCAITSDVLQIELTLDSR